MEAISAKEQALKQVSWMDSILSLIPGRKQAASNEPSDEAVKRTHDYLRCFAMAARRRAQVLHKACGWPPLPRVHAQHHPSCLTSPLPVSSKMMAAYSAGSSSTISCAGLACISFVLQASCAAQ